MSTIHEQPAIIKLAEQIRGNIGAPVLIVIEQTEKIGIRHLGNQHCFPRELMEPVFTSRMNVFGILQSDTLVDGESGSLGLYFKAYSKKTESLDGVLEDRRPFWLFALGDQLTVPFGGQAQVFVGPDAIAAWIDAGSKSWMVDEHLRELCILATALGVRLQNWEPLKARILERVLELKTRAAEKFATLQRNAEVLVREATAQGGILTTAASDYASLAKALSDMTGETLPKPIIEVPFQ